MTKTEPTITFRHLTPSPEIEAVIRDHVAVLSEFYNNILACRVVVEVPHRQHRHGNRCHVRIAIAVPGEELIVTHEPGPLAAAGTEPSKMTKSTETGAQDRDLLMAIHHAFDTARRRLEDFARRQRGAKKMYRSASERGRSGVHEPRRHAKKTAIAIDRS